jgi:hypothetical protein
LVGAATSQGGAALIQAAQGGTNLEAARAKAVQAAAQIDDYRIISFANAAKYALAGNDHGLFGLVAVQGRAYTDSVLTMRSALGLPSGDPEPDWFYMCFNSTAQVLREGSRIFDAASSLTAWSDAQTAMVTQTVDDVDTVSQLVDLIATGGEGVSPKASVRPGPNGIFSAQSGCNQILAMADTLSQRQWPA